MRPIFLYLFANQLLRFQDQLLLFQDQLLRFQDQLLRFQFEAHGKFTEERQKEKITKIVWFYFYQGWALQMGAGSERNIQ